MLPNQRKNERQCARSGLFQVKNIVILVLCTLHSVAAQNEPVIPLGIALESYPYPFPVSFIDLEMEGQLVRMAYMDVPPSAKPNGKTIVLLHGKNFGGYYWENTIRKLAAEGYRVVAPDQIGWGKSSKPDLRYSFQKLAANTASLLDHLGLKQVILVGHSTGGMLAVRFSRSYPERVERLVLEDPIGLEDYRTKVPPQSDGTLFQAELKNTDPEKLRAFYANYFAQPDPTIYGPLAEVQIRVTLSGEYARWAKASALAYQMIYEQPVCYEYGLLQPPTLLILGEKDHTAPMSAYATPEMRKTMGHVPELGKKIIQDVPHGTLVLIPQAGHIPHLEQPDAFYRAILAFLRD
jgi:pimeloyl-ACP methyl ester carboxylesterase